MNLHVPIPPRLWSLCHPEADSRLALIGSWPAQTFVSIPMTALGVAVAGVHEIQDHANCACAHMPPRSRMTLVLGDSCMEICGEITV